MNSIHFFEEDIKSRLKHKKDLKVFLLNIILSEEKDLDNLSVVFCSDQYLLEINKRFLNHNFYTDTISFLSSNNSDPMLGEIFISCERVKDNCKIFRVPYQQELIRVMIHSTLHLCGYLDDTAKNKNQMFSLQEGYLNNWFVSRGTANK